MQRACCTLGAQTVHATGNSPLLAAMLHGQGPAARALYNKVRCRVGREWSPTRNSVCMTWTSTTRVQVSTCAILTTFRRRASALKA